MLYLTKNFRQLFYVIEDFTSEFSSIVSVIMILILSRVVTSKSFHFQLFRNENQHLKKRNFVTCILGGEGKGQRFYTTCSKRVRLLLRELLTPSFYFTSLTPSELLEYLKTLNNWGTERK